MVKKKIIPALRFPEFEGEWSISLFNDYIISYKGGAPLEPDDFVKDSQYEVIPKKAITSGGRLIIDQPSYCEESFYHKYANSVVDNNYLITTLRDLVPTGPNIGYIVSFSDNKSYMLAQGVYGFLIDEAKLNKSFIIQISNRSDYRKIMQTLMVGSTQVHIRNEVFFNIKIALPTIPEQQKIASFLTSIDERIQQLTRKKNLLEQYKKGVMQKIFSREIRFKDDKGKDFPDWDEKTLGDIAEKKIQKNKDNRINNVFTNSAAQGIVNQRDFFDKDIANQNNLLNYYIVDRDDFVYNPRISNLAPVGPISRNHLDTGIMSPLYSVFRITQGNLDFFELYFSTTKWHEYMESIANYGARSDRMNITTGDFYNLPLPFPALPEQNKIASFLSLIDKKIELFNSQLKKTQTWKKGLLQKMFV